MTYHDFVPKSPHSVPVTGDDLAMRHQPMGFTHGTSATRDDLPLGGSSVLSTNLRRCAGSVGALGALGGEKKPGEAIWL